MKNTFLTYTSLFLLIAILINCKVVKNQKNDEPNCTKLINRKIFSVLENDFKLTKLEINNINRLIFNVYLDKTGKIDSLNFIKYKLDEKGISESEIKEKLKGISFKCIYTNYYLGSIKPTHYTFIFNPKMLE